MQRHDRKRLSDRDDAADVEELCTWPIDARLQSTNPIGGTTETSDTLPTAPDFDKTGAMALADTCSIRRNGCLYRTCQRRGPSAKLFFFLSSFVSRLHCLSQEPDIWRPFKLKENSWQDCI
ncbi:hypothetical protein V3C99_011524 [Haemonchus contortus]